MSGLEVFHILGTNMLQEHALLYHIGKVFEVPVVLFLLEMISIKTFS